MCHFIISTGAQPWHDLFVLARRQRARVGARRAASVPAPREQCDARLLAHTARGARTLRRSARHRRAEREPEARDRVHRRRLVARELHIAAHAQLLLARARVRARHRRLGRGAALDGESRRARYVVRCGAGLEVCSRPALGLARRAASGVLVSTLGFIYANDLEKAGGVNVPTLDFIYTNDLEKTERCTFHRAAGHCCVSAVRVPA